ncbi:MAG: type II toxin-antitoxin system RelE/ParE family toxin [Armatimonadota bacterium]
MYRIEPDLDVLLGRVRRKYQGNQRFISAVEEGLRILSETPRAFSHRIAKLPKGRYRYRHGRCRIIYRIDDDRMLVRILKIDLRSETTYEDL